VSYRADGQQTITQRYYPWGTIRPGPANALPTDHTFTGQKLDEERTKQDRKDTAQSYRFLLMTAVEVASIALGALIQTISR